MRGIQYYVVGFCFCFHFLLLLCVCFLCFFFGGGLLLRFYVYIFVGLIKHSELTLAGVIGRYRNDHYYYHTLTPRGA